MRKKKPATKSGAKKAAGGGSAGRRIARNLLVTLAAAYATLLVFGVFFADRFVFPAPRPSYGVTEPGLFRLALPGGGTVAALWRPAARADAGAILYFHGNGEDLGHNRRRVAELGELTGCAVLAIDYPGYGLSEGVPSEAGVLRAAEAAFDHLSAVRGYNPKTIVLWGYSLGTGPTVHLAARHAVRGVILNAPFTSVFRTAIPWKILPTDRFDSLAIIDRVQSPLLVTHGETDRVVPFAHGRALHDAAVNASPRRFLAFPATGHTPTAPASVADAYRREILAITGGPG